MWSVWRVLGAQGVGLSRVVEAVECRGIEGLDVLNTWSRPNQASRVEPDVEGVSSLRRAYVEPLTSRRRGRGSGLCNGQKTFCFCQCSGFTGIDTGMATFSDYKSLVLVCGLGKWSAAILITLGLTHLITDQFDRLNTMKGHQDIIFRC